MHVGAAMQMCIAGGVTIEPHAVRCLDYKPRMVQLRQRLALFIRNKRGNTPQRDFARKIGVAQSTIMRIENLDQNVTLDTLEHLCRTFHADIGDLFPQTRKETVYAALLQEVGLIHEDRPDDSRGSND